MLLMMPMGAVESLAVAGLRRGLQPHQTSVLRRLAPVLQDRRAAVDRVDLRKRAWVASPRVVHSLYQSGPNCQGPP